MLIVAVKGLIAIVGVVMFWPKTPPRFKKALILSIAGLWFMDAALESVQNNRIAKKEAALTETQTQMRGDLDVLKTNSEQDRDSKQKEAQSRQKIRDGLAGLIRTGIILRDGCTGAIDQPKEAKWTAEAELFLRENANPADLALFKSYPFPYEMCSESMREKIGALEQIIDKY